MTLLTNIIKSFIVIGYILTINISYSADSIEHPKHEIAYRKAKTIGIAIHSAPGGALCYLTICKEGAKHLGEHIHPEVVMSAIPLGLSIPGWNAGNYSNVAKYLKEGVQQVAKAGAQFYINPDNTAHIVLEKIADQLPIPGLHIAHVVCSEILANGWKRVGLIGTKWTMTGPVYEQALKSRGLNLIIPEENMRERLNEFIFNELCKEIYLPSTTQVFIEAINSLKLNGAECIVLGCTEIPIIINEQNSPLPILDSTRLLAKYAVHEALSDKPISIKSGWLPINK